MGFFWRLREIPLRSPSKSKPLSRTKKTCPLFLEIKTPSADKENLSGLPRNQSPLQCREDRTGFFRGQAARPREIPLGPSSNSKPLSRTTKTCPVFLEIKTPSADKENLSGLPRIQNPFNAEQTGQVSFADRQPG
jgi:hypothetical protein